MNYYPHHIGDFNSATRHLTRIERSVYRDLLDLYYDTESELTLDFNALCRLIIARSDEERTAVEQVLNEFFTETDQGWFHPRCDEEIQKYHANRQAKSAAGKASAARRARKNTLNSNDAGTNDKQTGNEDSTGVQQPLNGCATNQNQNQNQNIKTISSGSPDTTPPTKASSPTAKPSEAFMRWWSVWPNTARKADRKKCWEKWRAKRYDEVADQIVAHVEFCKRMNQQWRDGFEPAPLTYLNGERWNDGVVPMQPQERPRSLVL